MKLYLLIIFALMMPLAYAHEGVEHSNDIEAASHEESKFWNNEIMFVSIGSLVLAVLTFVSMMFKKVAKNYQKKTLFIMLTVTITITTAYVAADTIHTNVSSATGGPVHWHTDYEVWHCRYDDKLDLIDPTGFSNKIGEPLFHEHNDDRIHIEGAVPDLSLVGLDDYFSVVGGHLNDTSFSYLTEDRGLLTAVNGDLCRGVPGEVQIWLYHIQNPTQTKEWIYDLRRINAEDYIPASYGNIPPGDCVIIEFDADTSGTDHICAFYESAIDRGDLIAG